MSYNCNNIIIIRFQNKNKLAVKVDLHVPMLIYINYAEKHNSSLPNTIQEDKSKLKPYDHSFFFFDSRECSEIKTSICFILGDIIKNVSYLSDMSVGSDRSLWHLTRSEVSYLQGIQCGFPLMLDELSAKVRQVSVSSAHARSSVGFTDLRTEVSQGISVSKVALQ